VWASVVITCAAGMDYCKKDLMLHPSETACVNYTVQVEKQKQNERYDGTVFYLCEEINNKADHANIM
jgi:hypothetical protein